MLVHSATSLTINFVVRLNNLFHFLHIVCATCWKRHTFPVPRLQSSLASLKSTCPLFCSCWAVFHGTCLQTACDNCSIIFLLFLLVFVRNHMMIFCSFFSFIVKIVTLHYHIFFNESLYKHKKSFNCHKIHTTCTKHKHIGTLSNASSSVAIKKKKLPAFMKNQIMILCSYGKNCHIALSYIFKWITAQTQKLIQLSWNSCRNIIDYIIHSSH